MRTLTAVMYHYVRDTQHTLFPRIKALSVDMFQRQLDYFATEFSFITIDDLLTAIHSGGDFGTKNPVLLTFDDGYADHFDTVFPMLQERGIKAAFFPAARPASDGFVLDVNKIQFTLAACDDIQQLVRTVDEAVLKHQDTYALDPLAAYHERFRKSHFYDDAATAYVKRMLQFALPEPLRQELVESLFFQHVTEDEKAFARELYMSTSQLSEMISAGMTIGAHGNHHRWMNHLPAPEQEAEMSASLSFMKSLGVNMQDWVMCYPFGGYDSNVVSLAKSAGASIGFTTESGIADLNAHDALLLPRLDTNEITARLPA